MAQPNMQKGFPGTNGCPLAGYNLPRDAFTFHYHADYVNGSTELGKGSALSQEVALLLEAKQKSLQMAMTV